MEHLLSFNTNLLCFYEILFISHFLIQRHKNKLNCFNMKPFLTNYIGIKILEWILRSPSIPSYPLSCFAVQHIRQLIYCGK